MKFKILLLAIVLGALLGSVACGGGNTSLASTQASDPATKNVDVGALPVPPAGATTFRNLQSSSSWNSCNDHGCSGGSGAGTYWMAQNQSVPSVSGSSLQFYNSGGWSDALWWHKLGPQPEATNFLWSFDFQVDDASLAAAQALEFDVFQFLAGYNYMMGTECNYASGVWDLWDEAGGHWRPSQVPCTKFQTGTWHHVALYTQRTPGTTNYTFVTLSIDGTNYALNRSYSARNVGWDGHIGVQYQLDVNATGGAYQEWVDNVTLTAW